MKAHVWKASVCWAGRPHPGRLAIRSPAQLLKVALYAARGDTHQRGSNPPELIAAAHAGSFSLTLANELAHAGYHPRQVETTAAVAMENSAGGWTLTQVHLDVIAAVPRIPECDFVDAALRAKANCPISRALNATISMRARLNCRELPRNIKPRRKPASTNSPKTR